MLSLSLLPAIFLDIVGSSANIVLSFLALRYARLLSRRQPNNFVWGYLFYVTFAISLFTISRAVGHLVKQFLLIGGGSQIWHMLSPYSGGFNTLFMISVAAVMIFYHKGVQAYQALEQEAGKLKEANSELAAVADQLLDLNQTLEEKVEARTEELSRSERKFRHLFTASKDMVLFCQADGHLLDMNDSGLEMLGYRREDASRLDLGRLFAEPGMLETYRLLLHRDGYIKDLNVEMARRDGTPVSVLLSATRLLDENGAMSGSEIIAKDLTRVKLMLEQLASSEKMASVGQMAAGVAHEINTPLGVILGYAQLLMDDLPEGSEQYEGLRVIERQTKASRKIVADLLKFSRQSGSTREELDINDILADVVSVTEHTLGLSRIVTRFAPGLGLPTIIGDAEKLRQVFVNLVNNAHHAMQDKGGELHLQSSYDADRGRIRVTVCDTGCGIAEKNQARIFDPFFTTKPVGQGTGLGLSVTYGIVHEHGGTIEVESPVQDEGGATRAGTRFTIDLPIAPGQEAGAVASQQPAAA